MGMTIDFSEFEKNFKKLVENAVPEEAGKALFIAGNELLSDAVTIAPQAPKDVGDLWGSRRTENAKVERDKISCLAGFNIAYAAKWHEVPLSRNINWTTTKGASQPGPKYLESKMIRYMQKYMGIVADHIKRTLGG